MQRGIFELAYILVNSI